jgi:hypothetical protein
MVRPANTLPAIHQREQSTQNAGFDFIAHRVAASSHADQYFPVIGDPIPKFALPFLIGSLMSNFAAHGRAFVFDYQGEMHDALPNGFEFRGNLDLASKRVA